ncbi:DUF3850 domain-containing protein [Candidatus Microgenomates bacterium]|nr:DUF3850 domain-containing protein [Candidatus Microgenomates bacterium]
MIIKKKIWPEFFKEVVRGRKKFDVRLADFKCKTGDILILEEWNPKTNKYTGRKLKKKVTVVLRTNDLKFWPRKNIERYGFQIIGIE